MKHLLLLSVTLVFSHVSNAQNIFPASGNTGIGTTNPSAIQRLTLNGDGYSVVGGISFKNNGTEIFQMGNPTFTNNNDFELWNFRNGYLRFGVNSSEAGRINSTGDWLLGTIDNNGRLSISGDGTNRAVYIQAGASIGSSQSIFRIDSRAATALELLGNGNMTIGGAITASSFSGTGTGLTGTAGSLTAGNGMKWNNYTFDHTTVYNNGFDYLFARTTSTNEARLITGTALNAWLGGPFLPLTAGSSNPLSGDLVFAGGNQYIYSNSSTGGSFIDAGIQVAGGVKSFNALTNNSVRYTIDAAGNNTWVGTGTFGNFVEVSAGDQTASRYVVTNTATGGHSFAAVAGNPNIDQTGYSVFDITSNQTRLRIDNSGNIGIGTTNPSEKLSVNGNIKAKKLIITQNNWPDYVFHSSYKLQPLSDVEQFIRQYQRLPNMPSAKEVGEKGISVGENQALLLKKIEELTLYLLQQDKKIKNLEKKIAGLTRNNGKH